NGKTLVAMNLVTDILTYSDTNHLLQIPGSGTLAVWDFRPEKPGETQSSRGSTIFKWAGNLDYKTVEGTIDMNEGVTMAFQPTKPFHLPGKKKPTADTKPQIVRLDAKSLHADFIKVEG